MFFPELVSVYVELIFKEIQESFYLFNQPGELYSTVLLGGIPIFSYWAIPSSFKLAC